MCYKHWLYRQGELELANVLFLLSIFRPLRDNKVIEVFSATRKRLLTVFFIVIESRKYSACERIFRK